MAIYLKKFENHTQYENYINGSDATLPNVSICTTEGDVHYNPYVPIETRLVAKFNVTDTSSPTQIANFNYSNNFSVIEIDGVVQPSVVSAYTFSTTGEHTVKYTLTDITYIGYSQFYHCTNLTSVTIPDSVTSIDMHTFNGCSGLTNVTIGSGVTSIGSSAFYECSGLTSLTIGSGVTDIGNSAFYRCRGLTSINIPNSVKLIDTSAFSECSGLINITIPDSVTNIGTSAFSWCSSLTNIVSNAITAPTIQSNTFQGVKTGGTLTVPSGSNGYDTWMRTDSYYLGYYNWTKVEQ
jgi:hypothetical protein